MKKSLIALAALSAVAGAAQAQSNVEIYGLLDMSYSQIESSGSATSVKLKSLGAANSVNGTGLLNGSRLGFRGTEDLGGGTKAGFVYELGIQLTGSEESGTAANSQATATSTQDGKVQLGQTVGNVRQGYVSLQNNAFGTVRLGTQYSFVDATAGEIAGTQAHGGTNNATGAAALFKTGQQARTSNGITYFTPTFKGVTAKIGFNAAENLSTSAAAGKSTEFALEYVGGNFKAGYSYQKINDVANAAVALKASDGSNLKATSGVQLVNLIGTANDAAGVAALAGTADLTYNVFGASYDAGFAVIGLNRSTYSNQVNKAGAAAAAQAQDSTHAAADGKVAGVVGTEFKSTQNSLSTAIPLTPAFTLRVAYTAGKYELNGADMYGTKGYDLIGVYTLSKRTNVYAIAAESKFDNKGMTDYTTSLKQTQYGVGLRHSF